jgi:branched-chain amino acid transport system substrate-binding protein
MVFRLCRPAAGALVAFALLVGGRPQFSAHAAGPPVTIALVADVTGSAGAYGISIRNGARLAVTLLNRTHGIRGNSVKLLVSDGESNEARVTALYRQYSADHHVLGLIGPTLSSEAQVADPLAQRAGVSVIATSNTASGITEMGDHIFRMSLGEAEVIPVTIQTALQHLHFKKVAIIYGNDNAFTIGDGQIFQQVAKDRGLDVVDTETFATGDRDFSKQLTRIRNAHPDAVFVGALLNEAVPILVQGRQQGIPTAVHFIGGNGFNSPNLIKLAGKAAEGAIEGTAWFPDSTLPLNKQFVAAYKKRYRAEPDQFAAQAFDGVNIMAAGIRRANTTTGRLKLRNALARLKDVPVVTGSNGKFHFTPTRDAGETGTVQIVAQGKFKIYP